MATASPLRQERAQDQAAVKIGADHRRDGDQIAVVADPPARFWASWQAR